MVRIVISSGHGLHIRGASGIIDEVDESRRVVEEVANVLGNLGADVVTYHDDVSTSQNENLNRIVDFHNSQPPHDLDVSCHFNAFEPTDKPMGCEVLYVSQLDLADNLSYAMSKVAGFVNRGAKYRDDLFFLNSTAEPAVLIEVCFVDSTADCELYQQHFNFLCYTIARTLVGENFEAEMPDELPEEGSIDGYFTARGKCSHFGGPDDEGVSPDEGLAFIYDYEQRPDLFLDQQPPGTTGLARRLNPDVFYLACRWDYDVTPKDMLDDADLQALVKATKTGRSAYAWPADWGPHGDTDRVADLSPGLMEYLGITTDDDVEVIYPAPR